MNFAEQLKVTRNSFEEQTLERNAEVIKNVFERLLKQIKEANAEGKSEIYHADLISKGDKEVLRICNTRICEMLQKEGIQVSRNYNLKDFCWYQRSALNISW